MIEVYSKEQLVYFWAWCIKCPHCEQRFPLLNNMYLKKSAREKIGLKFTLTENKNFETEIITNISDSDGSRFTQKGGKATCLKCTNSIEYEYLTTEISKHKDEELLAIQIQKNKERVFITPNVHDQNNFKNTSKIFQTNLKEFNELDLIPNETIKASFRRENHLWHYGITEWKQYFNKRQLLTLCILLKNSQKIIKNISDEDHAKKIAIYLSLLISKSADYNALGNIWHKSTALPQRVHSLRQPSLPFNHVEINPFEKVAGSLSNIVKTMKKSIEFASTTEHSISPKLKSILNTLPEDKKFDLIITDPPYGDDVMYGGI